MGKESSGGSVGDSLSESGLASGPLWEDEAGFAPAMGILFCCWVALMIRIKLRITYCRWGT